MLLKDLLEIYIRDHSLPKRTEKSDRRAIRAPVERFGEVNADRITTAKVRDYAARRAKSVSSATVRREVTALQSVLNWGHRSGYVAAAVSFHKPRGGERRDKWLTEEDERTIKRLAEKQASNQVRLILALGLTYGARRGAMIELCNQPRQVNFQSGWIDFNVPGRPVNRKRRPSVPMTPAVRGVLEAVANNTPPGQPLLTEADFRDFKRFMVNARYEWVTPHVLKHSAITLLLRAGKSIHQVSALTQTDPRTLFEVYRHHSPEELLAIAER